MDLGLKAHVEHPVRFVQDKIINLQPNIMTRTRTDALRKNGTLQVDDDDDDNGDDVDTGGDGGHRRCGDDGHGYDEGDDHCMISMISMMMMMKVR